MRGWDVKKHKLQSGWVDGGQLLLVFVFIGLVEQEVGSQFFVLVAGKVSLDDGVAREA